MDDNGMAQPTDATPTGKRVTFGVFEGSWWSHACNAFDYPTIQLPIARGANGNPHHADINDRAAAARVARERLGDGPFQPDLLIDNGGAGLLFDANDDLSQVRPLHEAIERPLISHFIDPLVTVFQGFNWGGVWQCLQSQSWGKGVWDFAQARELQQFGIPNVFHLRMGAPVRRYDTTPVNPADVRPVVSFVGAQNSTFFHGDNSATLSALLPGVIAHAVRSDQPNTTFWDVYYSLYGLGEPPHSSDSPAEAAQKTYQYFNAKLFFNAVLCQQNRDRYVRFLARHLPENFELIGDRWDVMYGLRTQPRIPDTDAYFRHFREVAINLNLVNGNAESGLNMRHYEITAAGGFMLCHDHPEIRSCFEVGKECDVFRGEVELLDKIKFYLSHPEKRAEIAYAGQRRTLSQHLYSHRLQEVLRTFAIGASQVDKQEIKPAMVSTAKADALCAASSTRQIHQDF
ncbi:MAG: glycosyltransferase family protein [Phycisphaerae bacterium]